MAFRVAVVVCNVSSAIIIIIISDTHLCCYCKLCRQVE